MLVFVPIMLTLCSMLTAADYAQINACLIGGAYVLAKPHVLEAESSVKIRAGCLMY